MDNKAMNLTDAVSGAIVKTGSGTAIASGAAGWLGFAPEQWTIIVGVMGVVVAVLGVVVNGWVRWIEHKDKKLHRTAMLNIEKAKLRKKQ